MYRGSRDRRAGGNDSHTCAWCAPRGGDPAASAAEGKEVRRWCKVFKSLKASTTRFAYLEPTLKATEAAGFASAGVLPMRRVSDGDVELLFAREFREPSDDSAGGDRLDFLGGKRNVRVATALDVAINKFDQETARCLSRGAIARMHAAGGCPVVAWSPDSKFALFQHEFSCATDADIDIRCAGVRGAKRLEWVLRSQLRNATFLRVELHDFAATTLREMDDAGVLDALERVFDASVATNAAAAAAAVPQLVAVPAPTVLDPSRYDVVAALREAAVAARKDLDSTLPVVLPPNWMYFKRTLDVLHKADKRKLLLRFHPDRLMVRELSGRMPSPEEIALGTKAMTLLNALFTLPPDDKVVLLEAVALKAEIVAAERVIIAAAEHAARGVPGLVPPMPPTFGGRGGGAVAENLSELLASLRM